MPNEGEGDGKDFGKFCVFLSRSCGVISSISETSTCIVRKKEVCAKAREGMLRVHQGIADLSIYLHTVFLLLHVAIPVVVYFPRLQLFWCVVLSLSFPSRLHWWAAMHSVSQQDSS